MQKKFPLTELGKVLHAYIKDDSPYSLTEAGQNSLGITYANFHNRLSKNKLRIFELEKVLDYLGLEATISIGNMVFQTSIDERNHPKADYSSRLDKEERLLDLEEKYFVLRRQSLDLQRAIEEVKQLIEQDNNSPSDQA